MPAKKTTTKKAAAKKPATRSTASKTKATTASKSFKTTNVTEQDQKRLFVLVIIWLALITVFLVLTAAKKY